MANRSTQIESVVWFCNTDGALNLYKNECFSQITDNGNYQNCFELFNTREVKPLPVYYMNIFQLTNQGDHNFILKQDYSRITYLRGSHRICFQVLIIFHKIETTKCHHNGIRIQLLFLVLVTFRWYYYWRILNGEYYIPCERVRPVEYCHHT